MARGGDSKKGRGIRGPRNSAAESVVPDVYREMLADASSSTPTKFDEEKKPVKRRRVGGRVVKQELNESALSQSSQVSSDANNTDYERSKPKPQAVNCQTSYAGSEDSADSDVDWEEVDLKDASEENLLDDDGSEDHELNLVLGAKDHDGGRPSAPRRKPASAAEKKLRLEIHKMHLLSLLVHVHRRNHWCNDEETHKKLSKLLSKHKVSYLNPSTLQSQFQRSRSFSDGLVQVHKSFQEKFKITARGMRRAYWANSPEDLANASPPEDLDIPIRRSDFREIAGGLEASRDVGAQLFCALLRSAGVDARLVCSLQPLPFATIAKGTALQKSVPRMFIADPESRSATSSEESGADAKTEKLVSVPRAVGSIGGRNRFASLDGPNLPVPLRHRPKPKRIKESPYPIYWVEAFDEANQKWIPVDPLVTKSVAKPSKFEPPASDPENQLSYVVAFEDDGSARDVTRRYAKAYNAKTRRERVEATKGGDKWWRRVMGMYKRDHDLDRDQVEDAQLAQKEAQEGMPKNVQDFKDHPYYALERHLRRSEVIHPKREVGKVAAGKYGLDKVLEPIYRRRDLHEVRSADKWYRMGREIKTGEQPLKRVAARRNRDSTFDEDKMSEDDEHAGTGLYAAFQTTVYKAPPVVNGRIPKNIYGNLDIYVSSMVPAGGVHVPHPETARVAKFLGVDYADAITGFAFKGRHGTAITTGAVVATEYHEAVKEVIKAFEDERAEAEDARRSAEALRMWRRLLAGLRIRERIEGYEIEGERDALGAKSGETAVEEGDEDEDEGGGFLPDRGLEGAAEPTVGKIVVRDLRRTGEERGSRFLNDDDGYGGGFMEDNETENPYKGFSDEHHVTDRFLNNIENDDRGGFYAYDIDEDAEDAMRETEPADTDKPYDSRGGASEQHRRFAADEVPETIDNSANTVSPPLSSNLAGGFLLATEDQEELGQTQLQPEKPPEQTLNSFVPRTQELQCTARSDTGLAHEDLAEAILLQRLHETPPINAAIADSAPCVADIAAAPPAGTLVAVHEDMPSGTGVNQNLPPSSQEDSMEIEPGSPASDPGSLLSQDPEDEDADPEWLA